MARKVLITLRTAINVAEARGLIPSNPARLVALPRVPRYQPTVLTVEQARRFIEAAAADRYGNLFRVAIDSGMREGELLALEWSDVDLEAGTIRVTKTLENLDGRLAIKEAKTEKSRRLVILSLAVDAIRQQFTTTGAGRLVFSNTVGGYVNRANLIDRHYLPLLARADCPPIRFHDLRHSCASFLLAAGVDCKIVSERLGHASPAFTASVYQSVLPGLQATAAQRLAGFLADKTADKK